MPKGVYERTEEHCRKLKINARKGVEACRELGIGFFNSNFQSEMARRAAEVNKRNRTGAFFDSKIRSEMNRRSIKVQRKRKTGLFNPKVRMLGCRKGALASHKVQREKGVGLFDPSHEVQSIGSKLGGKAGAKSCKKLKKGFFNPSHWIQKIGGPASLKAQRENSPYWFMGVPFDSNGEKQAMLILCEKFNIVPKEGVNCHVRVNGGEIDFRPTDGLFIEYHPRDWDGLSCEDYYAKRRILLDDNGFRECELIVIKSLEELGKAVEKK